MGAMPSSPSVQCLLRRRCNALFAVGAMPSSAERYNVPFDSRCNAPFPVGARPCYRFTIVTAAVAVLAGSAFEVALTVTVAGRGTEVGAL